MTDANDADSTSGPTRVRAAIDNRSTVSEAVIETVAAATDTDPVHLPPLQNAVDTEALDSLLSERNDGVLTFDYAGCEVVANGDVTVTVTITDD